MILIGQGGLHRATGALVQIGHVGQDIEILVNPDAFQHGFKIPPLGLEHGFALPVFPKIDIKVIHKMDGAQDEVVIPLFQLPLHPLLIVAVEAVLHPPADGQAGNL